MKKIGFIILALVIAMGAMGASYAGWSKQLNVGGTIQTGNFDIQFDTPDPGSQDSLAYITLDSHSTDSFELTLHNAYPGFERGVTYNIVNNSTVPVKFSTFQYSLNGGNTWTDWDGSSTVILKDGDVSLVSISNSGVVPNGALGKGNNPCTLSFTMADVTGKTGTGLNAGFKIKIIVNQNS
jgi:hypothetical protein